MDIFRYFISFVFLLAACYFGIKGFVAGLSGEEITKSHKDRAIYYSIAIIIGLISFEIYFPTIAGLFCMPIVLLIVWMDYWWVLALFSKK